MKLKLMLLAMVVTVVCVAPSFAVKHIHFYDPTGSTEYCDFMVLTKLNHVTAEVYAQPPNSSRYWTGYHDQITNCGATSDFVDIGINQEINGATPPEYDEHGGVSASGVNVNDSEELGLPVYYLVDNNNHIWANFFGVNDGNFYYYLEGVTASHAARVAQSKKSTSPIRTK